MPKRVQRLSHKGYKTPENTVYVGRPTPFGSPFKLTREGWILCYSIHRTRLSPWFYWSASGGFTVADVVELYEQWVTGKLRRSFLATAPDYSVLRGKDLSCFCSLDTPCHADVLLKVANA